MSHSDNDWAISRQQWPDCGNLLVPGFLAIKLADSLALEMNHGALWDGRLDRDLGVGQIPAQDHAHRWTRGQDQRPAVGKEDMGMAAGNEKW